MNRRTLYCLLFLFLSIGGPFAIAEESTSEQTNENSEKQDEGHRQSKIWLAHILRQKKTGTTIPFLEFKKTQVPVTLIPKDGVLLPTVEINGTLLQNEWRIEFGDQVPLNDFKGKRDFTLHLFITGRINEFTLNAVSVRGESIQEKIFLFAPQSSEYLQVSPWNAVTILGGVAGFGYYQSDYGIYKALMSQMSVRYAPLEGERPWSWAAKLDMTLQTLNASPVEGGPQLISAKLNGTYRIEPKYDLRLSEQILFGINYLTMLSNNSTFGFSNLIAPEIGWRLRWKRDNANYLVGDFRLLTLSTDILKQRGFELSGTWSHTLSNMHNIEFGIDYYGVVFKSNYKTEIRTDVFTLQFGYSL